VITFLQQNQTAQPLEFLLVSNADGVTPVTGASPTVSLSKNGGSFASPVGAVSEIGNGWYKVAGNATDSNTLGPLILHATATNADPVDATFSVVAFNPQNGTNLGLTAVPATDTSGNALATAANLATANTNISAIETQTNKIGTNSADSPNQQTAQTTIASNLSVATSSLATAANLATASTNISAIESQTNKIGTNSGDSPNSQTAQTTIASNLSVATSTLATSANLATALSDIAAVETQTNKIGTNAADSPNAQAAQATIASNLDATVSSRLAASAYTAPPTDYQQRGVPVTLPSPPPSGYGSTAGSGSGSGPIAVNQNTGGTDNLRYVDSSGNGVASACILIYLATDWPGNPGNVQANATTGPDGRWLSPAYVNHGTYVAVFVKIGADGPDVSGPFTV
jgi:hypothetical protein